MASSSAGTSQGAPHHRSNGSPSLRAATQKAHAMDAALLASVAMLAQEYAVCAGGKEVYTSRAPFPLAMRIFTLICRILLILLLAMPVLGSLGLFPPPTAEMYTPQGWAFMSAMMATGYMLPALGMTFGVVLVLALLNRMALAAILLAPVTVNIMLFHWFLDASPVSAAAAPAYVLLFLNAFFLWRNWHVYRPLWMKP